MREISHPSSLISSITVSWSLHCLGTTRTGSADDFKVWLWESQGPAEWKKKSVINRKAADKRHMSVALRSTSVFTEPGKDAGSKYATTTALCVLICDLLTSNHIRSEFYVVFNRRANYLIYFYSYFPWIVQIKQHSHHYWTTTGEKKTKKTSAVMFSSCLHLINSKR